MMKPKQWIPVPVRDGHLGPFVFPPGARKRRLPVSAKGFVYLSAMSVRLLLLLVGHLGAVAAEVVLMVSDVPAIKVTTSHPRNGSCGWYNYILIACYQYLDNKGYKHCRLFLSLFLIYTYL